MRSGIGIIASLLIYCGLRVFSYFAKVGWDQSILFALERLFSSARGDIGKIEEIPSDIEVIPPDTFDELALLSHMMPLEEELKLLLPEQTLTLCCRVSEQGARLTELKVLEKCQRMRKETDLRQACAEYFHNGSEDEKAYVYSLIQVPVTTDPLWFFSAIKNFRQNYQIIVSYRGVNQSVIKAKIESARKLNSQLNDISQVDTDISFEEASHVLRGLSRGDDCVVEMSLVILSNEELPLDPHYFFLEKNQALSLLSVLGLRSRFHRGHLVRAVTATDFCPSVLDPEVIGPALLRTLRNKPLDFDPQDPRLDALHWLVSGATGTGKSFFVGLILLRMIRAARPISVLFIDHKRSFKRLVLSLGDKYVEPTSIEDVKALLPVVFDAIGQSGIMAGVELSDLPLHEKKQAASYVLRKTAEFLSSRNSAHTLYIVMDECWTFLKDDPQGVQQAFREFRKFDAAAVAMTQSLRDFISDETGQSIIQNADITILLRQKEDVTRFKDILDLSDAEMSQVKRIKKKKGVYSECLIKTPFLSRFGRLYPTKEEHELLRTDNLRAERVQLVRKKIQPGTAILFLLLWFPAVFCIEAQASIFGEETAVLLDMVSNQVTELSRLAENIGVAKEQRDLLIQINAGVQKATEQIRSIESIVERAQGVDPTSIQSLADINRRIEDLESISSDTRELLVVKLFLCDQAEEEAGIQSDTAYKMGQELTTLGVHLSNESKTASPGRAQQITASASSAQMLAMGVELQTLAQMSQLMAMNLDLQKSQMEQNLRLEDSRRSYLKHVLTGEKLKPPVFNTHRKLSKKSVGK